MAVNAVKDSKTVNFPPILYCLPDAANIEKPI